MEIRNIFKRKKEQPLFIKDYLSKTVNEINKNSVAFSCIDKIATAFASLSFGIYDKKTKEKIEHNIYNVLKEPNLDETHSLFFYQLIQDYFSGNVFIYKYVNENNEVVSLFRLNPSNVRVKRNEYNQKIYLYNGKEYTSQNVLHIPSRFGYDGLIGKSIFKECSKVFETSNNLDNFTNNSFDNNLGKRLVIDLTEAYPNATKEEQLKIRDSYIKNYGGSNNAGKPIVKTGKINFSTIDTGVNDNKSLQLEENRKLQVEVIANLFNIPVSYLTGENINDLESITTIFITQAIKPLTDIFEESLIKLFKVEERHKFYIEFNYQSLLKTSLQSKIDSYTKQLNNGILNVNEIRTKENLPPVEAGNYNFVPANLMPLTEANINAYMAKSKIEIENAEKANTQINKGSDKI